MVLPPIVVATSAPELPADEPGDPTCLDCGYALAKTDEGLCWPCSSDRERDRGWDMEIGGEG